MWAHAIQWKLGDHIMLAPVLRPGAKTWPVYRPAGTWVDAWWGQLVEGQQVVLTTTPR
jgi:alpha-glucosidase